MEGRELAWGSDPSSLQGLRIALNTQTPLIRFRDDVVEEAGEEAIDLSRLREPQDYKFSTGGVVRMVFPLLKRWLESGAVAEAEWVAMASGARGPRLRHEGVALSFVGLDSERRQRYASVKEAMWALLNSNPSDPALPHVDLPSASWDAFEAYQQASADSLARAARRMGSADLLYVHDFQQMGVARAWTGPPAAKLFHLHTPFPRGMPRRWADHFVEHFDDYDGIIVSTRRYAENLRLAGVRKPIHVVHPFIDPSDYAAPTPAQARGWRQRFAIGDDERIILNVGRMDPVKAQDRLIAALPRVLEDVPNARLVLVGNGSFSSSRNGGLGLNKGQKWRAHLESLADELNVRDRVMFTGHLDDALLPAAYAAADAFCLPSSREGFGLAVIEAWQQARPVVVSERAGVSELVVDDENGLAVDCADPTRLARALTGILTRPEHARAMGEAGLATSEEATLRAGRAALERVFASVLGQSTQEVTPRARA